MILSVVCVLGIVGSASFSIYHAMKALYESSLRDTWAILFLELETQSNRVSEAIPDLFSRVSRTQPVATFKIERGTGLNLINGKYDGVKTFNDLGIEAASLQNDTENTAQITEIGGDLLAVVSSASSLGRQLNLYLLPQDDLAAMFPMDKTLDTVVYVTNRAGKLIYTNNMDVTPENLLSRPLVLAFIKQPFRQGQSEFEYGHDSLYGFFQEIPRSNLILFAEKTKSRAMKNVFATIRKVAKASGFALFASIALLQIPLWLTISPIKSLTNMAQRLAQGDFSVTTQRHGFGEIAVLSRTFTEMTDGLLKRDTTIAALNIDRLEKTKMEQGLRVARAIQERFLFKPPESQFAGMAIAAAFEPSLELAGDWYGVYLDKERGEATLSIIDITGHGIESSLMTPVISVLFQEQMLRKDQAFDRSGFLSRCHTAMHGYGSGKITATGIVCTYSQATGKFTWISAGHPAPIIISPENKPVIAKGGDGGTLLGATGWTLAREQSLSLKKGTIVSIFSDGIFKTRQGRSAGFNRKDLYNALVKSRSSDVKRFLASITKIRTATDPSGVIEDDMCVLLGVVS